MTRPLRLATLSLLACFTLLPGLASAQQPLHNVDLARFPSISPDGQSVVFTWRGDLWKVSATGGDAVRLTSHPADELRSVFSPDGTRLAFTSDRAGRSDLYTMNVDGTGIQSVLALDRPLFLSDYAIDTNGQPFLSFTSYLEHDEYRAPRPYVIDADGGMYERLHDAFGRLAVHEPGTNRVAFVRGGNAWSRLGYRGPDARDLWLYEPDAEDPFIKLTSWAGNDGMPRWAGPGRIIFASDRDDNTVDLYLLDLNEHAAADAEVNAEKLTNFTDFGVESFDVARDGSSLVFSRFGKLYTLNLADPQAQPKQLGITAAEDENDVVKFVDTARRADEAAITPDGSAMAVVAYGQLYVRGTEEDAPTRRVTETMANHSEPVFSPDGSVLYFVSDKTGRNVIYAAAVDVTRKELKEQARKLADERKGAATQPATQPSTQPATTQAATQPADVEAFLPKPEGWADAVRFRVVPLIEADGEDVSAPVPSPDGKKLAYTLGNGTIVVRDLENGTDTTIFVSWDMGPQVVWSPDSKHLVYATQDVNFNADLWLTRADGTGWRGEGKPVNLTRHPDNDFSPAFSADGRILAFVSERVNEEYDVWMVHLDESLETLTPLERDAYYKSLAQQVAKTKAPETPKFWSETFSPTPTPSTRPATRPATQPTTAPATQPATAPATRSMTQPATRPTTRAFDPVEDVRQALRDFILGEQPDKPADKQPAAKKPEPSRPTPTLDDYPLETAYLRLHRVTTLRGDEFNLVLTPDASTYIFVHDDGLMSADRDGKTKQIGPELDIHGITPKGDKLVVVRAGQPATLTLAGAKIEAFPAEDRLRVDLAEQNRQKFLAVSRILGNVFYDPTMKGLDWQELTQTYLPLASAARTNDEFDDVAARFLGHLNASHLGVYSPVEPRPGRREYGRLGARYETTGDGFRVTHVLPNGPAGRGTMKLEVGDVITAVDFDDVDPTRPLETFLADKVDREIVLGIRRGDEKLNLLITPADYEEIDDLSYDHWRNETAKKVDELSDGKLGYIHIRGMDQGSLDTFERDLYAAAEGKKGLIIDVRNNGGGWTTDRLLTSIMYPRHAYTVPRGQDPKITSGYPQDRLYIKNYDLPINMLANEKSFSNAEIISHAFKTLNRGTLVGQQTSGGVISTGATRLVDGTLVRLPFRGWYLPNGEDMENNGAVPDLLVPQTPEAEAAGNDEQLRAAVEDLLERLE